MKYDGVVIRLDRLYLFLLDPETNRMMDGVNISEHDCYNNLKDDQLMVVSVIFKDGTVEIENMDLDEFVYGDSYGSHDTFLYINDIMLFTINEETKKEKITLEQLIDNGELNNIATNCIEMSKKENLDNE